MVNKPPQTDSGPDAHDGVGQQVWIGAPSHPQCEPFRACRR